MRIWHMSKIQIFIFSTQNQHYDEPSNKHKNTCQFHFFYSHKFIWRIYYLHRKKCHMFCLKANLVVLNSLKRNQRHKNWVITWHWIHISPEFLSGQYTTWASGLNSILNCDKEKNIATKTDLYYDKGTFFLLFNMTWSITSRTILSAR